MGRGRRVAFTRGGAVAGRRVGGRDGVAGAALVVAAPCRVAARLHLLPRRLGLLPLQLQLHLELLELGGRRPRRVDLAARRATHARQLRQQL